ncbi:MAG: DUF3786 domain-containing protein [Planctomycetota bacterium]|nr:DUF3786 domain-containing protein [Planctomycetota bacterium]
MIDPVLWDRLSAADPSETSARSLCRWDQAGGGYVVPLLGGEYLVRPSARAVETLRQALRSEKPAGFNETLLSVNYLLFAQDIPPGGKLLPPERLPEGQFFFRGIHALPLEKLTGRFGNDPEAFLAAGKRLGAEVEGYGDASFTWNALPRIPITFVLWKGDDEFPPRASVLFDSSAHRQMVLDALGALASLAIRRLIAAADEVSGRTAG